MNEEIKALIDEAIKEREGYYHYSLNPVDAYKEEYETGIDKGIDIALSLFKWRKVEEELPEFNGVGNEYPILVRKADNTLHVFWVFMESMEFLEFNNVAEWMPIPNN